MITTIITTYHRPKLLENAVNSVLNQTYKNFQLCVYDNGSDSETADLMKKFQKMDDRIRYFRHPVNIGMMLNYKYAFERVNTPFFSFLSDDDFLSPWFFETALKGFENSSEVAFSACGVDAIDENGNCVARPLSTWKSEGFFQNPQGIFEMIKEKGRLPIPTAILFKTEKVKNITPDWSDDIRIMWDPDYLLRIAAKHPFFISKKICATYLTHSNAFSSSFYYEITHSSKPLEKYLLATKKMLENLSLSFNSSSEIFDKIKISFDRMLQKEMCFYIRQYIFHKHYEEARITGDMLKSYCILNKKITFLLLLSDFCEKKPIFHNPIRRFLFPKQTGKKLLQFLFSSFSLSSWKFPKGNNKNIA